MRQFTCPKAVTHPSTNRARCRATALIETNALPLHQTANQISLFISLNFRIFIFIRLKVRKVLADNKIHKFRTLQLWFHY